MAKFIPIGMRVKIVSENALIINTCGANDTAERGTFESWAWCNPTNHAITHHYEDIGAVSVESLWQGTKLMKGQARPDDEILQGKWRKNKGKRPIGAYAGPNAPLITTPGGARRKIYLPAYKNLVDHWLKDETVQKWVADAKAWDGDVYLRDLRYRPGHR